MTVTTPTGRTITCRTSEEAKAVQAWLAWLHEQERERKARAQLRARGLCGDPTAHGEVGCTLRAPCRIHGRQEET